MNDRNTAELSLTELAHGGCCGCKIASVVLAQMLSRPVSGALPEASLVGVETSDVEELACTTS